MILMPLKRLESFLMNVEVIFYVKKQRELEKKLRRIEAVYNDLKEKERKGRLTSRYLKNLKKDLEKLKKYSITYGLDYLFNELNEVDYYEPKKVKSAFNGSYVLYESKGDKDCKLSIYKYFDIIRSY